MDTSGRNHLRQAPALYSPLIPAQHNGYYIITGGRAVSDSLNQQTIVIAGGSGFLGISLAQHLSDLGASIVILSRGRPKIEGPWQHIQWDGRSLGDWQQELEHADGLVNLAGRNVNCLKTPDHQDEILRSRVESTQVLGEAMRTLDSPPPVWVQMSTAHIYGDPPRELCTEDSPFGYGLAPDVGRAWEEAFRNSILPSQRGVILRTSFVVGKNRGVGNGALGTLGPLTRLGLGGRVGSGTQGMSWIHELDMNRLVERGLTESSMQGAYIASSPNPVAQVEFMKELRRAIGMPIGLPSPAWLVRIGVRFLLRTDPDLALYGRYVVSNRLHEEGFEFQFPHLSEALADLYARSQ